MSAILRLTEESIVLEGGKLAYRAPSAEAVDYYMDSGFSQAGERCWQAGEIPAGSAPFCPVSLRVRDLQGRVVDTVRSVEPVTVELEYELQAAMSGLRVGIYLLSMRGEYVFVSYDTDNLRLFEQYSSRDAGRYISRCIIPANLLNEGRYILGVNASSYRIQRYFQEEHALAFNVDATGAPGKQWPEPRLGSLRPGLDWSIEIV